MPQDKTCFLQQDMVKKRIIGPFFLAPWNQAKIQFQFTKTKSANTNGKQGKHFGVCFEIITLDQNFHKKVYIFVA